MEEQLKQLNERLTRIENNLGGLSNDQRQVQVILDATKGKYSKLKTTSKTASSEDQGVDEAGSAAYTVLKSPDGFLAVVIGTTTYNLPYYS